MIDQIENKTETLQAYFEQVFRLSHLLHAPSQNVSAYRAAIDSLVEFAGRDVPLASLDGELVDRWLRSQYRRPRAIDQLLRHVLAVWQHAHLRGLAPQPPGPSTDDQARQLQNAFVARALDVATSTRPSDFERLRQVRDAANAPALHSCCREFERELDRLAAAQISVRSGLDVLHLWKASGFMAVGAGLPFNPQTAWLVLSRARRQLGYQVTRMQELLGETRRKLEAAGSA